MDSLSILERRVRELNSQAAVAEAVSAAQKEFTRFVRPSLSRCQVCTLLGEAACRYIFHEVRGPLNNIGLGVELLSGLTMVQEDADMRNIVSGRMSTTGTA